MDRKLSNYIRKHRKKSKMTQKELASALGYPSLQIISNVERGVCALPIKRFKETSKILNISLSKMQNLYLKDIKSELEKELHG